MPASNLVRSSQIFTTDVSQDNKELIKLHTGHPHLDTDPEFLLKTDHQLLGEHIISFICPNKQHHPPTPSLTTANHFCHNQIRYIENVRLIRNSLARSAVVALKSSQNHLLVF